MECIIPNVATLSHQMNQDPNKVYPKNQLTMTLINVTCLACFIPHF